MNTIKNKLTLFLVLGILSILIGLIFSIIGLNSNSVQDGLKGICVLFGMIPVLITIGIDRICVSKFGTEKVNKTEFYILGTLLLLFIINWIRLQLQR